MVLIAIHREVPLSHDVIRAMVEDGFRLYDLVNFFYRPYDNALWQVDCLFVRVTSPLISSRRWN